MSFSQSVAALLAKDFAAASAFFSGRVDGAEAALENAEERVSRFSTTPARNMAGAMEQNRERSLRCHSSDCEPSRGKPDKAINLQANLRA